MWHFWPPCYHLVIYLYCVCLGVGVSSCLSSWTCLIGGRELYEVLAVWWMYCLFQRYHSSIFFFFPFLIVSIILFAFFYCHRQQKWCFQMPVQKKSCTASCVKVANLEFAILSAQLLLSPAYILSCKKFPYWHSLFPDILSSYCQKLNQR